MLWFIFNIWWPFIIWNFLPHKVDMWWEIPLTFTLGLLVFAQIIFIVNYTVDNNLL